MKTKPFAFCPECSIGLNGNEMRMRFCQNCKAHWSEEDEEPDNEEDELINKVLGPLNYHDGCDDCGKRTDG